MGYNTYPANPWPLGTNQVGQGSEYELPTASADTLGGVKVGEGLTITDGVLSSDNPTPYELPEASDETLGGVIVGSGLSIADGVLSATGGTSVKKKSYTGTGTAANALTFEDDVNFVLAVYRLDEGVFIQPFALAQRFTKVHWIYPSSGAGNVNVAYNAETHTVTITGTDAGQACNSEGVSYELIYM